MLNQVYSVLKSDSRKGDFFALVQKDHHKLEIKYSMEKFLKNAWNKYLKHKIKNSAFKMLISKHSYLEDTKEIIFHKLKMGEYLQQNWK